MTPDRYSDRHTDARSDLAASAQLDNPPVARPFEKLRNTQFARAKALASTNKAAQRPAPSSRDQSSSTV